MALTASRRRGLVAAACAAVVLPTVFAGPALAQTGGSALSGATQASAVRITLNLPGATQAQLLIDPVSGTVRSVTGSTPEAQAVAALIAGSIGGQAMNEGRSEAKLTDKAEDRKSNGSPPEPFSAAIAGSPLAQFLSLELLDSSAEVTEAPTSTSEAQIAGLAVGLPPALLAALSPALGPVIAGVDQLLADLADGAENVKALCDGVRPAGQVTDELVTALDPVPGVGELAKELVGGASTGEIAVLCSLPKLLEALAASLNEALTTLAKPGGILSIGLITGEQSIVRAGTKVTATSTAQIADLSVLGQSPFGQVDALRTTSVATADGSTATATVDAAAVDVVADPLAVVRTDLDAITGLLLNDVDLEFADEIVNELQALFEALLGIGIDAGRLGSPADAIAACPEELGGSLSGTFQAADGSCAVAAARGYGLAVTLPAQIAGPANIVGPLVEVALVPSAAVAKAGNLTLPATTGQEPPGPGPLPRTGPEAPLAAAGLVMLLGAAFLRRHRGSLVEQ